MKDSERGSSGEGTSGGRSDSQKKRRGKSVVLVKKKEKRILPCPRGVGIVPIENYEYSV